MINVADDPALTAEYGGAVPCVLAELGGRWVPVKRQAPRLSADAMGARLQAEIEALQQSGPPA